jgi:hypothetical protein
MADFGSWEHSNLVDFAQAANEENKKLRADIEVLLNAWRAEVKEKYLAAVLAASPSQSSPSR